MNNILIDIGHPGHVHLFRNSIKAWKNKGHYVVIAIRDRGIVGSLLMTYGLDFSIASKPRSGIIGKSIELLEHDWNILKLTRRYNVKILLGTSVSIAHISKIVGAKSIVFNEDDNDYIKAFAYLTYPFADTIVIPDTLRDKRNEKYITYSGYQELAYLHPNQFKPDPRVLSELHVQPGEPYFIIRLVALSAYHDIGQHGLNLQSQRRLLNLLSKKGKVFITVEGNLPTEFRQYQLPLSPHLIHHALYYAAMLVSDSQTMTIEAAVLGTPVVRCNTFVGKCSVIEELEHKYGLTYGFLPQDEERMFAKIEDLLSNENTKGIWQQRRDIMLAEKIDLTEWMVNFVENYPIRQKKIGSTEKYT